MLEERRDDVAVLAPTAARGSDRDVAQGEPAEPPSTEIFCSFPVAKKATHCPSGEKKGAIRPVRSRKLSGVGLVESASKESSLRTYTSRVPSGERIVSAPASELSDGLGPRSTSKRTSGFNGAGRVARYATKPRATATMARTPATIPVSLPSRDSDGAGLTIASPDEPAIHSNSSFKSRADCQRLSGSFAKHFCNTRSSAAGATSAIDGAGRSIMAAITLAGDEPSNTRLPVSISYSTKPNEKMSLRGPASCPVTCSGDMYWNVPSISPLPVNAMLMVPSPAWIAGPIFASPKSSSFTPALVTRIFAGFRSR